MRRSRGTAGYTLLELLVVLAVAGFIMASLVAYSTQSMPGTKLKSAAQRLADTLRTAQAMAITDGTPVTVTLARDANAYIVEPGGETTALAPGTRLSFAPFSFQKSNLPGVKFYPDGSAVGGDITLASGIYARHIRVDWLTSRVSLDD